MDPKKTWPVVKFVVAATGLGPQDARKVIEQDFPREKHSLLFMAATQWNSESTMKAVERMREIIGDDTIDTLAEATRRSSKPSTVQERMGKPRQKARR